MSMCAQKTQWIAQAIVAGGALLLWPLAATAETGDNPYLAIVDRNTFGLKPPPPPPAPPAPEPVAPPPANTVRLTGITSVLSKTKALFEITEPGSPDVRRPIMAVGDPPQYGVELLSIDLAKDEVRIRNGDTETSLTFEDPGAEPPPPAPGARPMIKAPVRPGVAPTAVVPAAPPPPTATVVGARRSSSNSRSTIAVAGGSAPDAMSAYTSGGNLPTIPTTGIPNVPTTAGFGQRGTPNRPVRTPTQPNSTPMTREEAIIRLELQREINRGQDLPPLPPTPITPAPTGNETQDQFE